jgi:hypothetical protein
MRILKVDDNCSLVEWKYKDFLKIGGNFQGSTIIKLERHEYMKSEYVKVVTEKCNYKI